VIAGRISGYSMNKRFLRRDGKVVWTKLSTVAVRNHAGELRYFVGMAADVSDQKRAEEGLRQVTGRLLTLQDEERRRIARELHDSLGQDLAAMNLNLARLREPGLPGGMSQLISDTAAITEKMLTETRTLSYLLHPPLLDELGLSAAVRLYVEGFSERSGIEIECELPDDMPRLSHELELTIFRIVQEAVTNVHRHSGSGWCKVSVRYGGGRVSVEIRDNGVGLPPDRLGEDGSVENVGVGISGMRERARHLGGTLVLESAEPGCIVRADFPIGEN
jgi:signal transduction histidine kinase